MADEPLKPLKLLNRSKIVSSSRWVKPLAAE